MKLVSAELGVRIELKENKITVLNIENPGDLRRTLESFNNEMKGEEGVFVLSNGLDIISIKKNVDFIINPLLIDLNNRRMKKALYQRLAEEGKENYIYEKNDLNSMIINIIDSISMKCVGEELAYNMEFEWEKLFKFYDIKIFDEYDSLLEAIISYIKSMIEFCDIEIFVFYGLKDMLDEGEIDKLYSEIIYLKVHLILLESHEHLAKHQYEEEYALDKDRCFIVL